MLLLLKIQKHFQNICRNQIQYLSRVCLRVSTISSLSSRLRHLMAVVISSICRVCSLQCKTF